MVQRQGVPIQELLPILELCGDRQRRRDPVHPDLRGSFGAGALRRHDRTAGLGEVVVIAKGAERIGKFEETWLSYRKAAERMKREYRLYANGAGAYREVPDENERRYGERATTRVRYADRAGLLTLRRAEPVGIIH